MNALVRAIKDVREFFVKRKARDLRKPQEMYVCNLPGEALEIFWFCNEIVQENKLLSVDWRNTAVYILVEELKIRSRMSLWRSLTSDNEERKTSLFERFDSGVMNLFLTKLQGKRKKSKVKPKDSTSFINGDECIPGIATTRILIAAESIMNEIKNHGARTKYVNRDTESEGRNRFCPAFGQYFCDCSGFVCALLKQTLSMEIVNGFHSDRPYLRARDFCAFFASRDNAMNKLSLQRGAWRRVSNLERVRVGDFISWLYVGHTNKPIRSAYIDHKEKLDSVLRQVGWNVRYAARQREGQLLVPHRVRKESHAWVRKMKKILEEELNIVDHTDLIERLEKDPDGLIRDLRSHDTDQVLIDRDVLKMLQEASSDRTYSSTGHIVVARGPPSIRKHDDEPRHRFMYEFEGKVYERIAIATMDTYESNAPDGVTTRSRVFWCCRRVSDGHTVWFPKKSLFRAQPRHVGIQIEIGRICL